LFSSNIISNIPALFSFVLNVHCFIRNRNIPIFNNNQSSITLYSFFFISEFFPTSKKKQHKIIKLQRSLNDYCDNSFVKVSYLTNNERHI